METTKEITKTLGKTFLALKIVTGSGIGILTAFLIFFIVAVTQNYNDYNPDLVLNVLIVFLCFVVLYVVAAITMLVLTRKLVKKLDIADKAEQEAAISEDATDEKASEKASEQDAAGLKNKE